MELALHDYITDRVTQIENKGQQERVTFCTGKQLTCAAIMPRYTAESADASRVKGGCQHLFHAFPVSHFRMSLWISHAEGAPTTALRELSDGGNRGWGVRSPAALQYGMHIYMWEIVAWLTLSLPQPVEFPGWKMHGTDAPANSVFSGRNLTHLLSMLCVFVNSHPSANKKTKKGLRVSNFAHLSVVFKMRSWQWRG